MGCYHLLVNESKKEYVYFDKYNLSVKNFVHPKHGMLIAWILQKSAWEADPIRVISDCGNDEYFYEICGKESMWKNREEDFVDSYNKYLVADGLHVKYPEFVIDEVCANWKREHQ